MDAWEQRNRFSPTPLDSPCSSHREGPNWVDAPVARAVPGVEDLARDARQDFHLCHPRRVKAWEQNIEDCLRGSREELQPIPVHREHTRENVLCEQIPSISRSLLLVGITGNRFGNQREWIRAQHWALPPLMAAK